MGPYPERGCIRLPFSTPAATTSSPMEDPNPDVYLDFSPYFRLLKSGAVDRLSDRGSVPAGYDPTTGVTSKDVVIDLDTGLSARLYLPNLSQDSSRLPVLVYFHGGAFVLRSAADPAYHAYLNSLTSRAHLIAVSVEYRRAPEHPLPAAYDDSWAALRWAALAGDPWLAAHGNVGRIFLAGDSAGGNIAHNVAMRAAAEDMGRGARIEGLLLLHAWFSGRGAEAVGHQKLWRVVCPDTEGIEKDKRINAGAAAAAGLEGMAGERMVVCVAERDALCGPGKEYAAAVRGSRWKGTVEVFESEGVGHVFHLHDPAGDKAVQLMERAIAFFAA